MLLLRKLDFTSIYYPFLLTSNNDNFYHFHATLVSINNCHVIVLLEKWNVVLVLLVGWQYMSGIVMWIACRFPVGKYIDEWLLDQWPSTCSLKVMKIGKGIVIGYCEVVLLMG